VPGPYLNQGIFRTRITGTDTTAQEELGVFRYEAGKILRYVQAQLLVQAREPVRAQFDVTTAALMGNRVLASSAVTDMFFGIAEVTLPALGFGWVTVYGPATARVDTAAIPGSPLGPSGTSGVLTIRNTSHFNAAAIALQTGLSAGSAIFISNM